MRNAIKKVLFIIFRRFIIRLFLRRGLGNIPIIVAIYKFIEARIMPKGKKLIMLNGCKFMTAYSGVGQGLICDGEYEPETTRVFKILAKPRMKIVDIGANNGYFTVLAGKMVGAQGKVWAFEPEQNNFNDLIANIQLNNLKNVIPIQKAISNKNGQAVMYTSKVEPGECSLFPCYPSNTGKVTVETTKLDSILSGKVDIIKSDTEGNELAVLLGARNLLANCNGVKLFIEIFPVGFKSAGYTTKNLWDTLQQCGFKYIYILNEKTRETKLITLPALERYSKRYGGTNVLCSKLPAAEIETK